MSQVLAVSEHSYLNTIIESSIAVGQTPTAMLMDDPSRTEWTALDLKLIKAHYLYEQYSRNGWPIWIDQSPRMIWDVQKRTSRSQAAVERKSKPNKEGKSPLGPGEYFIVTPRVGDGGPWPTKAEWLEEQASLSGKK